MKYGEQQPPWPSRASCPSSPVEWAILSKCSILDSTLRSPHSVGCKPHAADESGSRPHRGLLDCSRTKGCCVPHILESNSVTILRYFHGFARCVRIPASETLRRRPTGSRVPDTLQLPGFTSMRIAVLGSCCRLAKRRRFAGSGGYSLQLSRPFQRSAMGGWNGCK